MFYAIRHFTRYRYSRPVWQSMMEMRMHPRSENTQRCFTFQLSVISALTTLFMVSCTSWGGSISLSSVRRISMPQLAVSVLSAVRSSSLILPAPSWPI